METLLTVQQICDQLQVSDQTVRRWIKGRQLPAMNLGGKAGYRVKSTDLEAFLKRREALARVGPVRTDPPQNVEDVQWHRPGDTEHLDADPKAAA